jgi:hypothetical protein
VTLSEVAAEIDPFTPTMARILFLITVVGFVVGVIKGVHAWRRSRDEAVAARTRHEDALTKMLKQFENNGGSSLLDKVEEGNREAATIRDTLNAHVRDADLWFAENNEAHKELHRRIDGVLTILGGGGLVASRQTAERHKNREGVE